MMKNGYFVLKALFAFKIFKCCSDAFGHVGKWLDEKAILWSHNLEKKQLK